MSKPIKTTKTVKKIAVEELPPVKITEFPPVEDMIKELDEMEKLIEDTKLAQVKELNVDTYVIPLGKYKSLSARSVCQIETFNKYGKKEQTGKKYIAWLINQEWLHTKDKMILSKILTM